MVRKIVSAIVVVCFVFSIAGIVSASDQKLFDLIDYLQKNDVDSRAELQYILNAYVVDYASAKTNTGDEVFFEIEIDEDKQIVEVTTIYEISATSYTTSGSVSHEVFSSTGSLIYTIVTAGTFSWNSQVCSTTSASGSFQPASGSTWSSAPTISRGNLSRTQAYARTSGTARSGLLSNTYNLTLICNTSGVLSATYS